ncbi:MAG: efflux RND transporter periplasmic adaptor subunit [Colwellia sp.]|nr:efflux RND transporter periplasmic adaptor subunit [Colwellia sp.]MCW8864430.1 efflux RND transporter periplasmic adaptor subunit [Colwellia sp.]MCW9080843.1 efflux RND transporter periplasmic adaptor subunit [Colwellia sp.]
MSATSSTNSNKKHNRRMVPLRYVLMPFAIVFLAIIVLVILQILAPKPAKKAIAVKAPLVNVMPLQAQDVIFTISSQGSVEPRTKTTLISEVSGVVTHVSEKFHVGGFFKKGEVLLTIDDITYQVALLRAQAQLESAQALLVEEQARSKQAEDEWRLTGKPVDHAPVFALRLPQLKKAEASVLAAQADLREAKVKLARTKIIAPYDAMLTGKQADLGQYITMGSALANTFAIDYAEVRLPIKQRDVAFLNLSRIHQLDKLNIHVDLFYQLEGERHAWTAKVTRYEGVVDSANRVHYVVAQIDDPYGVLANSEHEEIRMGTFVNAKAKGKQLANVTAIPLGAVYSGNTIHLIDDENRLSIEQINILRSDADYAYTRDEFSEDKRLILTKLATPIANMLLRVDGEQEKQQEAATEESLVAESETSTERDSL